MHERCPKCRHAPLPADQAFPAACPACGVILAKAGQPPPPRRMQPLETAQDDADRSALLHVPARVEPLGWRLRLALWVGLLAWSWGLVRADLRTGEIGASFLHRPLLVFHEAGHVLFIPFGEWLTVAGGSLFQLLVPAVLAGALLLKNRDPFGASIGLWFLGVSLLDLAPYVWDALDPQLTLLGGSTGADGPHDWIYLLRTVGLREQAHLLGRLVHLAGVLVVLAALGWAGWLLRLQRANLDPEALRDGD